MAQRTAFLNSDAKGFNKDFHHTWISNYMLKQPGVMFSNYSTKPEFALGNGQISGGKAIIRCTRTTGTFAGEEILACFESTSTENISTAGNKKVYIEIPEVYVNDSTAITDSLTQGANLNVGRIVSSDSYPTHSNYIPLWEITNGDWQNATDLRPEVLRRGKPNTLSYFGGNGEEERIDIDNASLNKYLMSNGAGVAPTWEEGGGGGGGGSGENFKRAFTADEDLLAKSMFGVETQPGVADVDTSLNFGTTTATKVFFPVVLSGETFSSLTLNLTSVNSPADTLSVRIETLDNNGLPSGTLVNVGAYGTATVTSTATDVTVNLSGTVEGLTAHTKAAVVLERSGSSSDSNYYKLGCLNATKVISLVYSYNGTTYSAGTVSGCVDCTGFMSEAVVQATSLNGVAWLGYCESGALAGNDFTGILQGTIDYEGAITGIKYYLSTTGELSLSGNILIGNAIIDDVVEIFKGTSINGESGDITLKTINGNSIIGSGDISVSGGKYDAIVAADGTGDYLTVPAALTAGKHKIYVKNGTYNHVNEKRNANTSAGVDVLIEGESRKGVVINFSSNTNTTSSARYFIQARVGDSYGSFLVRNMTFNVTPAGETAGQSGPYNSLFYSSSSPSNQNTFRVENCNIIFNTTQGCACLSNGINMSGNLGGGTFTINDKPSNGFFNCYIATATGSTYAVGLTRQPYYDSGSSYGCAFEKCYIRVFGSALMGFRNGRFTECYINANDAGINNIRLYDSYMSCDNIFAGTEAETIGGEEYTRVNIGELKFSVLHASTTINPADRVNLGDCVGSSIAISASTNALKLYQNGDWICSYISVDDDTESVRIQGESFGCEISCNAIDMYGSVRISGCEIGYSTSGIHTQSEGQCNITGSRIIGDWTFLGEDVYGYGCAITGNICGGSGQDITLDGYHIVFTGNTSNNLHLTLGDEAYQCTVSGNYVNSFETTSGSNYCVIVGNMFSLSQHSQGTNHTYYGNAN